MAATYGRLTGKVGVCMSTLGPAQPTVNGCRARAAWRYAFACDHWAKGCRENYQANFEVRSLSV